MDRMSSRSEEPIDAIVMAGTKGAKTIELDGQNVYKPLLEIGGEPLVQKVTRAVLGAKRIGRVYIVGQIEPLEKALAPLFEQFPDRISLVPEGTDILDNGYRAFFRNLLPNRGLGAPESPHLDPPVLADYRDKTPAAVRMPVFVVTSDLPFLSSGSIDRFIDLDLGNAAIMFGLVDYRELDKMRAVIGEQAVLDQWKLGAIHFRRISVRMGNMFLLRPLLGDPALYTLLLDLYAHRWLLKQDGSVNWRNWWAITKSMIGYSIKAAGWIRFLRGLINFIPAMLAASLARLTHRVGRWLSWPFRLFVSKNDVQFIGSTMIACQGHLAVSKDPGPAIDIDVKESYLSLIKDGEKDFHRIADYLKENLPD